MTQIHELFNFPKLLRETFSVSNMVEDNVNENIWHSERITLRKNEKRVLYELLKHPHLNDVEIAKRLGLSKVTSYNIRKKFRERGLLHEIILPNLKKLGFELLVFSHLKFKFDAKREDINTIVQFLKKEPCVFFLLQGIEEVVCLCAFKNYSDYKQKKGDCSKFFEKRKVIGEESLFLIPLQHQKFEKFSFGPLTKKLLEA